MHVAPARFRQNGVEVGLIGKSERSRCGGVWFRRWWSKEMRGRTHDSTSNVVFLRAAPTRERHCAVLREQFAHVGKGGYRFIEEHDTETRDDRIGLCVRCPGRSIGLDEGGR